MIVVAGGAGVTTALAAKGATATIPIQLGLRNKVPTMFEYSFCVDAGGLVRRQPRDREGARHRIPRAILLRTHRVIQ